MTRYLKPVYAAEPVTMVVGIVCGLAGAEGLPAMVRQQVGTYLIRTWPTLGLPSACGGPRDDRILGRGVLLRAWHGGPGRVGDSAAWLCRDRSPARGLDSGGRAVVGSDEGLAAGEERVP